MGLWDEELETSSSVVLLGQRQVDLRSIYEGVMMELMSGD